MTALLPVEKLISIGVVVDNLERATQRYAQILGIDTWQVRNFDVNRLTQVTARGRTIVEPSFRTATGTTVGAARDAGAPPGPDGVPVTFELVQPLRGETPFQEFRFRRHQGISHLTLAVATRAEFAGIKAGLERAGIAVSASMVVDGVVERHFVDTRAALGGFHVEIIVTDEADPTLAVDEVWDHSGSYERPAGVGPLAVQGVGHFGVVVNDVIATIERYHEVFGIESWKIRDWRTEPGLLENPTYRGEEVDHEYFTGIAPFADFGFEIIEPTFGPSHYNREFRDLTGEGVHHLLLSVTATKETWDRNREWLTEIGVPLAMGSKLIEGSGEFCYYDTSEPLGGWMLEATCYHFGLPAERMQPEYVIDFSTLAAIV